MAKEAEAKLFVNILGAVLTGMAAGVGFYISKRLIEGKSESVVVEKGTSNYGGIPKDTHGDWFTDEQRSIPFEDNTNHKNLTRFPKVMNSANDIHYDFQTGSW